MITSAPASVAACPRCQQPLIDPAGMGWCKACGFCRALAETETQAAETSAPAPNTMTATGYAIAQAPTWIWIMLAGMLVVIGVAFACGRWLPLPAFERALFTTLVIAGGLGIMFAGQFMALLKIAPDEPTLSFKDAVFPFRLYGLVLKHLPSTRYTLYLGVWSIAAIVSAAIFIGGLGHWFNYLPNSKNPPQKTKNK